MIMRCYVKNTLKRRDQAIIACEPVVLSCQILCHIKAHTYHDQYESANILKGSTSNTSKVQS